MSGTWSSYNLPVARHFSHPLPLQRPSLSPMTSGGHHPLPVLRASPAACSPRWGWGSAYTQVTLGSDQAAVDHPRVPPTLRLPQRLHWQQLPQSRREYTGSPPPCSSSSRLPVASQSVILRKKHVAQPGKKLHHGRPVTSWAREWQD